jgi:hypothetical protein|tara:strand:+ start:1373 stop:1909 length:537 start_codon:yes stop_codon:yes gene_type:complete
MAIRTTQVTSSGTIESLRNEFNNLVTDVSALEAGTLNFSSIAASAISVGDLSITGGFNVATLTPTTLTVKGDRIEFEGTGADDAFETTLVITNPTADRTITFKDQDGTVAYTLDLGFTNSTLTVIPGSAGATDLADGETPFDAGATDSFGISLASNLYDMNEPKGSTESLDIGQSTGI